jgi:hypothetical protein
MPTRLHANATTTPKIRACIQPSPHHIQPRFDATEKEIVGEMICYG